MERNIKIITVVGIAVAVLAVSLYVAYDLNGNSMDFGDRETRVIVTSSMDGDNHPSHWYSCEICGHECLDSDLNTERTCPNDGTSLDKHSIDIHSAPLHSLVMIKHLDSDEMDSIHVGDVISFHKSGRLTIHRVISINKDAEGNPESFVTKGDNAPDDDGSILLKDVTGIVVGESGWLGKVVYFVQNQTLILVMAIVVIIVMLMAARDIIRILSKNNNTE